MAKNKKATKATTKIETEIMVQLATRVPKTLHQKTKLHCVEAGVSIMGFLIDALSEKLTRDGKAKRRA